MASDIIAIDLDPINDVRITTSVLPTGRYSSRLVTPTNMSIVDIQDKYDDRFDDPSYYYGGGADGGNVV